MYIYDSIIKRLNSRMIFKEVRAVWGSDRDLKLFLSVYDYGSIALLLNFLGGIKRQLSLSGTHRSKGFSLCKDALDIYSVFVW